MPTPTLDFSSFAPLQSSTTSWPSAPSLCPSGATPSAIRAIPEGLQKHGHPLISESWAPDKIFQLLMAYDQIIHQLSESKGTKNSSRTPLTDEALAVFSSDPTGYIGDIFVTSILVIKGGQRDEAATTANILTHTAQRGGATATAHEKSILQTYLSSSKEVILPWEYCEAASEFWNKLRNSKN